MPPPTLCAQKSENSACTRLRTIKTVKNCVRGVLASQYGLQTAAAERGRRPTRPTEVATPGQMRDCDEQRWSTSARRVNGARRRFECGQSVSRVSIVSLPDKSRVAFAIREGCMVRSLEAHSRPYVTVRELAEDWSVSDRAIHRLIRTGRLRAVHFGPRSVRISTAAARDCEERLRFRIADEACPNDDSAQRQHVRPSERQRPSDQPEWPGERNGRTKTPSTSIPTDLLAADRRTKKGRPDSR